MQQIGKFILLKSDEISAYLATIQVNRVIKLIQEHHTYIPDYTNFTGNNHFALLQGMENAHIARGFAEIAQHFTTFSDGTVAVCRDLNKIPAGIMGANEYGICIENVGNFDTGKDIMSTVHKNTIVSLTSQLCKKFHLDPSTDTIVYHHWYDMTTGQRTNGTGNVKSCPGTNFFGGNTVQASQSYFVPLIKNQVTALGGITANGTGALQQGRVRVALLNVRSGPGTNFSTTSQLTQGTRVGIYDQKNGWYMISQQTQPNWVAESFVDLI